jgi:hypothetical protein
MGRAGTLFLLVAGRDDARADDLLRHAGPEVSRRRWCLDGGGNLTATLGSDPNVARLVTTSPRHRLHGIGPGKRVRWRAGQHHVGRNVVAGVRGHRVRWLAVSATH